MGGVASRIGLSLALLVVAAGGWASTATGASTIVASPETFTYEPGPYVQGLGEVAIFDNSRASAYHDVTTLRRGPDGGPLFFSEMIPGGLGTDDPAGQVTPVNGTQYLTPGSYPFYCTLHGQAMSGELVIDGSQGKAVKRPGVRVTILKQKLKRVRKSGIKVRLKALGASRQVTVTATRGKVRIGARKVNFKAGQTRRLNIPLTRKGRQVLRKGRVAKLKVRTSVAFGKPQQAARKLR